MSTQPKKDGGNRHPCMVLPQACCKARVTVSPFLCLKVQQHTIYYCVDQNTYQIVWTHPNRHSQHCRERRFVLHINQCIPNYNCHTIMLFLATAQIAPARFSSAPRPLFDQTFILFGVYGTLLFHNFLQYSYFHPILPIRKHQSPIHLQLELVRIRYLVQAW